MKAPKLATFKLAAPNLYRSSRPNYRQIKDMKDMNITLVYDFRHRGLDDLFNKFMEKFLCKIYGIEYHRMPFYFRHKKFPTLDDFEKVSKAIADNKQKGGNTLIHCRFGRHRLGQYAAWYELTQGKPLEEVSKSKDFLLRAYELIDKWFNFNNKEYWKRDYKSEVVKNRIQRRKNIENNKRLDALFAGTQNFLDILYSKSN